MFYLRKKFKVNDEQLSIKADNKGEFITKIYCSKEQEAHLGIHCICHVLNRRRFYGNRGRKQTF